MEMKKKCPYINRDDVAQMLIEGVLEKNSAHQYAEYIRMLVYSVPSADAAPVRHGRWIEKRGVSGVLGMLVSIRCSVCGCEPVFDSSEHLYNYCPNCGAKMDEGETNE